MLFKRLDARENPVKIVRRLRRDSGAGKAGRPDDYQRGILTALDTVLGALHEAGYKEDPT